MPLVVMSGVSFVGCQNNSKKNLPRITYGTLVDKEATKITYPELKLMITNKENFLIAIHQDLISGPECGCWVTFKNVLDEYVQQYHTTIYYIDRSQFSDGDESFGLSLLNNTTNPVFALVKDGKKVNEYIYGTSTKPLFESVDGMRKVVEKIAKDPQYLTVDQTYLDDALFNKKQGKVLVYYYWSSCPDCNDMFPRVLQPYTNAHNFTTPFWIIDLDIVGLLRTDATTKDKTNPAYVNFLKEHHMSKDGDATFGYDRGFVPTTQVWEEGVLKDMCVYFNDAIEKDGEQYKITRSFFSAERVPHLGYTDTILEGTVVPNEELEFYGEMAFWKADYAAKKHQPLMEAFLDKYTK